MSTFWWWLVVSVAANAKKIIVTTTPKQHESTLVRLAQLDGRFAVGAQQHVLVILACGTSAFGVLMYRDVSRTLAFISMAGFFVLKRIVHVIFF